MPAQRHTEVAILGYRIDRIVKLATDDPRFEVIGPERDELLAVFRDRRAAEQFVLQCELRSLALRPRHPAW